MIQSHSNLALYGEEMMVEMTIQIPEPFVKRIWAVRDRLPEMLAHGLGELSPLPNRVYRYILTFLIGRPTPEEIVDFGPTAKMQARVDKLLEKNQTGTLTPAESAELDEYVRINHFVTMIKARTLPYLSATSR